jgi:hypothetical protein
VESLVVPGLLTVLVSLFISSLLLEGKKEKRGENERN